MRGFAKEFYDKFYARCGRAVLIGLAALWVAIVIVTLVGSFYGIPRLVIVGFYSQDVLRVGIAALFAVSPIFFLLCKGCIDIINKKAAIFIGAVFIIMAFGVDIETIAPSNKDIKFSSEQPLLEMHEFTKCETYENTQAEPCAAFSVPNKFVAGQKIKIGEKVYRVSYLSVEMRVERTSGVLWRTNIISNGCDVYAVDDSIPVKDESLLLWWEHGALLSSEFCSTAD